MPEWAGGMSTRMTLRSMPFNSDAAKVSRSEFIIQETSEWRRKFRNLRNFGNSPNEPAESVHARGRRSAGRRAFRHSFATRLKLGRRSPNGFARREPSAAALALSETAPSLDAELRRQRHALALAVALGDLAGELSLEEVTALLSDFADRAIDRAVEQAIRERVPDAEPAGFAVIAMGKLGSRELNYSSDVDLLLLFDPETLPRPAATTLEKPRSGSPANDRAAAEARRGRLCRRGSTLSSGRSR